MGKLLTVTDWSRKRKRGHAEDEDGKRHFIWWKHLMYPQRLWHCRKLLFPGEQVHYSRTGGQTVVRVVALDEFITARSLVKNMIKRRGHQQYTVDDPFIFLAAMDFYHAYRKIDQKRRDESGSQRKKKKKRRHTCTCSISQAYNKTWFPTQKALGLDAQNIRVLFKTKERNVAVSLAKHSLSELPRLGQRLVFAKAHMQIREKMDNELHALLRQFLRENKIKLEELTALEHLIV